jgi:hypothetical protein
MEERKQGTLGQIFPQEVAEYEKKCPTHGQDRESRNEVRGGGKRDNLQTTPKVKEDR